MAAVVDAVPTTPLERFKGLLQHAAIGPDKPLYPVLITVFEAAHQAHDAVGRGARGLSPKGEADLVERVAQTAAGATRQEIGNLARATRLRSCAYICLGLLMATGLGFSGGYWARAYGERAVAVTGCVPAPQAAGGEAFTCTFWTRRPTPGQR